MINKSKKLTIAVLLAILASSNTAFVLAEDYTNQNGKLYTNPGTYATNKNVPANNYRNTQASQGYNQNNYGYNPNYTNSNANPNINYNGYPNKNNYVPIQNYNNYPNNNNNNPGSDLSNGNYNGAPMQPPGFNQPNYTQNYGQNYGQQQNYNTLPPLQGHVATAPVGTAMTVRLPNSISSEYATVGQRINTTLSSDLSIGGNVILPMGSVIEGQVVDVKKAGRFNKNGVINIRFTSAIAPNGQRLSLSAKIATEDGTGLIKGGTTTNAVVTTAKRTAVGAGLGAVLGTGVGAASGGKAGKGAVYGTAIGSGVGLFSNVMSKGKEAILNAHSSINIVLEQALTTNVNRNNSNHGNSNLNQMPY